MTYILPLQIHNCVHLSSSPSPPNPTKSSAALDRIGKPGEAQTSPWLPKKWSSNQKETCNCKNKQMEKDIEIPTLDFDTNGNLIIVASPTSSKSDFDFFEGKWNLHNKKLKTRLNGCTDWIEFYSTQEMYRILNGNGNIDNFLATFDGEPFEGMTLRLFSPITKLWSIYWADTNKGELDPPVKGSFDDKIGHFFTKDVLEGKLILVVFRWDIRDKENPVWSQAFSEDNGATWEWNWYMFMSKAK